LYKKQKNLSRRIIERDERYRSLVDFNRLTELSELTASLSHELNQPLTAILSSTQAAQRFLKKDKFDRELFDEILANIVEDVKRASGIMNSLRNMIKKDTRVKKHVNLNSLAKDIFHLFYSQAAVRDIKIEAEFDESEPFILADSILIQQVILNLLLNATEALENSTQREKEILLKTEVNDGFVTISVSDNGPGINENLKEEIFKPFFSTKTTGLGIGLAISRSIIEDHDSRIMILNNDTGGATFSFNLIIIQ
jgi:C4-dicarboxylate-specific signal transduction histidine kinase